MVVFKHQKIIKHEKRCVKRVPILSFFWSLFFRIWTGYGESQNKSLYSVQIRENTDQKKNPYLGTFCTVKKLRFLGSEATILPYNGIMVVQEISIVNVLDVRLSNFYVKALTCY